VILLDTNVISAFMKPEQDAAVVSWLNTYPRQSLWITAISVFEIRTGLEILALGRRRQSLEDAFALALEQAFSGRIVPFDESAAQAAGTFGCKTQGWPAGRDTRHSDCRHCDRAQSRHRHTNHPTLRRSWNSFDRSLSV